MKDSLALRFLYGTLPGRAVLKLLVRPGVSKAAGAFLASGASGWIVPLFIRKNRIDMRGVEIPPGGFSSFNDFFIRKRKGAVPADKRESLICPCDGFLSCEKIREDTELCVKHTRFSVADLLKDARLAEDYRGGTALIFRLTPVHYHRYCYAAAGRIRRYRRIAGVLHCVRPVALRTCPVFAQNSREYQVIETEQFGRVVQMEVGALLVGKIRNHPVTAKTNRVFAGQEKGYFEFGGSTVILLLQKGVADGSSLVKKSRGADGELPVKLGEDICPPLSAEGTDKKICRKSAKK